MNLSPLQKQRLIKTFPELDNFFEQQKTRKILEDVKAQSDDQFKMFLNLLVEKIKQLKGDKGDTPIKGKDYFTDDEINKLVAYILKESTPVKGKHYKDGEDGKDYVLTRKDRQERRKKERRCKKS